MQDKLQGMYAKISNLNTEIFDLREEKNKIVKKNKKLEKTIVRAEREFK